MQIYLKHSLELLGISRQLKVIQNLIDYELTVEVQVMCHYFLALDVTHEKMMRDVLRGNEGAESKDLVAFFNMEPLN